MNFLDLVKFAYNMEMQLVSRRNKPEAAVVVVEVCYSLTKIYIFVIFRRSEMTYISNWDEFCKAAERLYMQDPMKVRIHLDVPKTYLHMNL